MSTVAIGSAGPDGPVGTDGPLGGSRLFSVLLDFLPTSSPIADLKRFASSSLAKLSPIWQLSPENVIKYGLEQFIEKLLYISCSNKVFPSFISITLM